MEIFGLMVGATNWTWLASGKKSWLIARNWGKTAAVYLRLTESCYEWKIKSGVSYDSGTQL